MSEYNLTYFFCDVDDFVNQVAAIINPHLLDSPNTKHRHQDSSLCHSEIMTILIAFHHSGYRTFKHFYIWYVTPYWKKAFPGLVSYTRFLELMPRVLLLLCIYLKSRYGRNTGIAFIDSTKIAVCHAKRISSNRVFQEIAHIGKSSMGWFFGFKLHWVINDQGELLGVMLTPAMSMTANLSWTLRRR